MNSFGIKLTSHFQNNYSKKKYIEYLLSPRPHSSPIFTINWYIPSFISINYLVSQISNKLSIDTYPGKVILGISGNYLLDHPFSAVILIEIQTSNLNQSMYDSLVNDFDSLISTYEGVYEITKPFSTK